MSLYNNNSNGSYSSGSSRSDAAILSGRGRDDGSGNGGNAYIPIIQKYLGKEGQEIIDVETK